jgi:hypothetical protein
MTVYTIRAASSGERISTHQHVDEAVAALTAEELAHHLNRDKAADRLELVVTADREPGGEPGEPVVLFAALGPAAQG